MSDRDRILDAIRDRFGSVPGVSAAGVDDAGQAALASLLDRRSCRAYAGRAVPEGLVRLILSAGLSVPAKSDLQQADVVWVRDEALRAQVVEGIDGSHWIARAPVFLVVCGNGARFASLFEGGEFPNDHFDALFNAIGDAAILLEGTVAAAAVAGLATCPISMIRNRAARVAELLGLPERVFPFAGLCLGYPERVADISPRFDQGITLHENRYDTEAFARLGPAYDARRNATKPFARQRDPQRFGTDPDYSWREDKRRQYSDPQRTDFGAWLRSIGFSFE
jgi:nitroreductase/FMN reductase [NAD(P)H]